MTAPRFAEVGRRIAHCSPRAFRTMGMAFVPGGKWIVEEAVKAELQARAKATATQFQQDLAQLNAALITPQDADRIAVSLRNLARWEPGQ